MLVSKSKHFAGLTLEAGILVKEKLIYRPYNKEPDISFLFLYIN